MLCLGCHRVICIGVSPRQCDLSLGENNRKIYPKNPEHYNLLTLMIIFISNQNKCMYPTHNCHTGPLSQYNL